MIYRFSVLLNPKENKQMKTLLLSVCLMVLVLSSYAQTRIRIDKSTGFDTPALQNKLNEAIGLFEKAINTNQFANLVLIKKLLRRNGLSHNGVLDKILNGEETGTIPDHIINLTLEVDKTPRNEIGHTTGHTITTQASYILNNPAECYAAHLMHEYCHVLGFTHPNKRTLRRTKTVPYQVGYIVRDILGKKCP
jgi:hypothetical protein